MLTRRIPIYQYQTEELSPLVNGDFVKRPFYLEFSLPSAPQEEKTLLSLPGALTLRVIRRSYDSSAPDIESIRFENCFYFNETDEWILECLFTMKNDTTGSIETFPLRLPLSAPFANGTVALAFSGDWLRFIKDGECLNENSGLDRFAQPTGELWTDVSFASARVGTVKDCTVNYREIKENCDMGFYEPYGWNAHVGDVMNFYHNGVYHLLYLFDRRHHKSRNGRGAHYVAHLTSSDLIDWEEQPLAVSVEQPWQSVGTGTMLWHNGKYYLSYGLHTERYVENKGELMGSAEVTNETNEWNEATFDAIFENGKYPTGATYAESDDGIHFVPSNRIFHIGRNPSAYTAGNKIVVYSGYVSHTPKAESNAAYESDGFGLPFRPVRSPNCFQKNPPMKHTTECPSLFEFGGYRYALLGFTGYYRTLTPNSDEYADVALRGESIYDGLCVPMVAPFGKDRLLISGWLAGGFWGSMAMHRELFLEENGVLGMKWVSEMLPPTLEENLWADIEMEKQAAPLPFKDSYLITATVDPNQATLLAFIFRDASGEGFEFRMDFDKERLQINDATAQGFAPEIPAAHEIIPYIEKLTDFKDIPRRSKNFTLTNINCMKTPFSLRILCRYSRRQRATVLDVEIAGRRTIVSIRHGCFPTELQILKNGNAKISDGKLSRLSL